MDPVSALSVAGIALQLVSLTSKIVSRGWRLYRSTDGSLLEHRLFELTTNDLMNLIKRLRESLPDKSLTKLSESDRDLALLCEQCTSLGETILEGLKALKIHGKNSPWRSFRQALKVVWETEELDEMAEKLLSIRKEVETNLLVSLKVSMDTLTRRPNNFDQLDPSTQNIISAIFDQRSILEDEIRSQTAKFEDMHQKTEEMMFNHLRAIQEEIRRANEVQALQYVFPRPQKSLSLSVGEVDPSWRRSNSSDIRNRIESILIDGLQYQTMSQRYDAIAKPHRNTFRWIYQKPKRDWSNFVEWLREGSGIYWINGKAGSGKTTLMRYIHDNPITRQELSVWAGDESLQISSFFFWNSGTLEQKSQTGLLRSLLFEILSKWRNLIPVVLPEQWARRITDHPWSTKDAPIDRWSEQKLRMAFYNLVHQTTMPLRICLFIDGLDEYDGNHIDIVRLFESVVESERIKVCLSSRPTMAFEGPFEGLPSLRLQDLTFEDIRSFVTDKLAKNDQMKQLINEEPERAPQLIVEIVEKAQGVFLWVDLVVASLLNGLQNRDRISDLQRRVKDLPPDLENLYKHMLQQIEPFYRAQASQIFQLVRAAREQGELEGPEPSEPLTLLMFSFAEEEVDRNVDQGTEINVKPLTDKETLSRWEAVVGRIKSRCRGLLEVHDYQEMDYETANLVASKSEARVMYIHRTARDFLEEPNTWNKILEETRQSGFDVNTAWLRACLRRLQSSTIVNGGKHMATSAALASRIAFDALCYATKSYCTMGIEHNNLLNELDRTMLQLNPRQLESPGPKYWAKGLTQDSLADYPENANLLTAAAQFGLTYYVRNNLAPARNVLQDKSLAPLLWFALSDASSGLSRVLGRQNKLDTVALLLRRGADPNEKIHDSSPQTIWQYFLQKASATATYTSSGEILSRQLDWGESRDMANMFKLLIRCKANPNARTYSRLSDASNPSAFEIMEVFQPGETAELQALLLKSGARVSRRNKRLVATRSNKYGEVFADITDARVGPRIKSVDELLKEIPKTYRIFPCLQRLTKD